MSATEQAVAKSLPLTHQRQIPRSARLVIALLERLRGGSLLLQLPDSTQLQLGQGPLQAHWYVYDWQIFSALINRADVGLGESWIDGGWHSDELPQLLTLLANNRATLGAAIHGRWLALLSHRLYHALRHNSRKGSRRNIATHYDLGNDFYALWLDHTMSYSSARFTSPLQSLADAQLQKYRTILDRLQPQPGDTILEVGCGWGGFAEVAVQEYGCRVHGITLSQQQLDYARQRALTGGYSDRADFQLCDYRDVEGVYDHIVSIEMIEAVGERYWPIYFQQLAARLRPSGSVIIQAITIDDALFGRYRRGTDFIQRYIFPGGMLPSPQRLRTESAVAGLRLQHQLPFGYDYAETLRHWRERFLAQRNAIRRLGYPERFMRMWEFYLAFCEAGFNSGDLDVVQLHLTHA